MMTGMDVRRRRRWWFFSAGFAMPFCYDDEDDAPVMMRVDAAAAVVSKAWSTYYS